MSKHKKNNQHKQFAIVTHEKPCNKILKLERENLALHEDNAMLSVKCHALKGLSAEAIKAAKRARELLKIASSLNNAYRKENRILWVAFTLLSITNIVIAIFFD